MWWYNGAGHGNFAKLLVDEVARTLDEPTPGELESELRALELLRYCQSALPKSNPAR